mmetsp:Transcript_31487/g.37505  ORF Transcript_31487/g.37505 Transcript_31487/m.37505 type:complete len:123 (+) Transcript_31487:101-469(+)
MGYSTTITFSHTLFILLFVALLIPQFIQNPNNTNTKTNTNTVNIHWGIGRNHTIWECGCRCFDLSTSGWNYTTRNGDYHHHHHHQDLNETTSTTTTDDTNDATGTVYFSKRRVQFVIITSRA